eukprot:TRINITY_DN16557_c0_g1_i1.p1 TRINITY_DN16557_c0_g1~~TRINITY_DN16557_c0_g1_i1.p1  ORF type:complete len:453 (+),score=108.18 TRINITY_DN16557_c0_g1_i1:57-1361(+)
MQSVRIRTHEADANFTVEVSMEEQISDVIERLSAQQGFITNTTRLVLRGKVAKKDTRLHSLNLQEKDVMVVVGCRGSPATSTPGDNTAADNTETVPNVPIDNCFPSLLQRGYTMEQIHDALEQLPAGCSENILLEKLKECRVQSLTSMLTVRGYQEDDILSVIRSLPQDASLSTIEEALHQKPATATPSSKKDDLLTAGFDYSLVCKIFDNEPHYFNLPLDELKNELSMMETLLNDYPLDVILKCFRNYENIEESDRSGDKVEFVHNSMLQAPPPPPDTRDDVVKELVENQGFDKLLVLEVVETSPEGTPLSELRTLIEDRQQQVQLANTQTHLIENMGFDENLVMSLTQGAYNTPLEELIQTLRLVSETSHADPVPEDTPPPPPPPAPVSQFDTDVENLMVMTDGKWTREGIESVLRECHGDVDRALQRIFPD